MAAKKTTTKKTTTKKPVQKVPEVEIVDSIPKNEEPKELLAFNPLLGPNIITIDDENEQKVELIEKTDSLTMLNKQYLKAEQEKANLEIELQKIGETKKLTEVINSLIDLGLSEEIVIKVSASINDAKDLKMYSEAVKNFAEIRNRNMNNMLDEDGNKKRMKVLAQFQMQSGEKATMAVEVDSGD